LFSSVNADTTTTSAGWKCSRPLRVDVGDAAREAVPAGLDPEYLRLRPNLVVARVQRDGRWVFSGLALASTSHPKRVQKPQ
jgi:hypothetical protein